MNNLSLLQISVDNQNPFIHIIVEVEMIFTVDKANLSQITTFYQDNPNIHK